MLEAESGWGVGTAVAYRKRVSALVYNYVCGYTHTHKHERQAHNGTVDKRSSGGRSGYVA